MTTQEIETYFSIGKSVAWIIGGVLATLWALHKFYLSSLYVSKKEFESALRIFETAIKASADKGTSYEADFRVFLATYKGDMDMIKLKGEHNEIFLKDILHRVNNIQSTNYNAILEMVVEEKLQAHRS